MPEEPKISVEQLCEMINLLHPCMDDYLYVYDIANDYYYISPEAVEHFALPASSFHDVVANHAKFVYPPDVEMLTEDLEALTQGKKDTHNLQYRWLSKSGEPVWINCCGKVVRSEDGSRLYMVGCVNEIGKRQKADNVSGLLGMSSLESFCEEHHISESSNGLMMRLGIDDFKEINEKLGITYGDMILRKTAQCISDCLLEGQTLYRALSDEFVIMDMGGHTVEEAVAQYRLLRGKIDEVVKDNQYEAVYTISAGILTGEGCQCESFVDMMRISEFALNEAKRQGKNRSYVFSMDDYGKYMRQKRIAQLLRNSVNNNFEGFEAFLQPLFNPNTNKLYGAEALMRYRTEEFGMISPAEFVPILEETGLIIPTGRWMLHRSLQECSHIHQLNPDFRISINISYIQVMKSNIINEIIAAIDTYQIPPDAVIIELTESGRLISDSRIAKLWKRLKAKGIRLALDDFGTGYSNFHYLNDLHPEIIKIDRSFTMKAMENDYEYKLLSLMSDMVHSLEVKVCVEGIENTDELGKMMGVAPDYCQGYLFGKPCSYQEFVEQFINKE